MANENISTEPDWTNPDDVKEILTSRMSRNGASDAEIQRKAILVLDVGKTMTETLAHFFFEKSDGSIREAFGTRKKTLIEKLIKGNPVPKKKNPWQQTRGGDDNLRYYDLTRHDWRCCCPERIISIDKAFNEL
jgi:hypothetical protein